MRRDRSATTLPPNVGQRFVDGITTHWDNPLSDEQTEPSAQHGEYPILVEDGGCGSGATPRWQRGERPAPAPCSRRWPRRSIPPVKNGNATCWTMELIPSEKSQIQIIRTESDRSIDELIVKERIKPSAPTLVSVAAFFHSAKRR